MNDLSTKQASLLLAGSLGLMALNIFVLQIFIIAIVAGVLSGHSAVELGRSLDSSRQKAIGPAKIDGRTSAEWFEVLKMMGKAEYERMKRHALDGLEDSAEGWGGWDVKKLLGDNYHTIMEQWYPEKYCEYCGAHTDGVPGACMWDGPCHGFQSAEYARKRREEREKEIAWRKQEIEWKRQQKMEIMNAPKAEITTAYEQKSLRRLNVQAIEIENLQNKFRYHS